MTLDPVRRASRENDQGVGLALVLEGYIGRGGALSGEDNIINFDEPAAYNPGGKGLLFVARTDTTAQYITVLESGLYSIYWSCRASSNAMDKGVTKNAKGASDPNGLGSDFTSSDFDKLQSVVGHENTLLMAGGENVPVEMHNPMSSVVRLEAGDRVRFHISDAGGTPSPGGNNWARIEQLMKF